MADLSKAAIAEAFYHPKLGLTLLVANENADTWYYIFVHGVGDEVQAKSVLVDCLSRDKNETAYDIYGYLVPAESN